MFKKIIDLLKKVLSLSANDTQSSLDAYITAGNPQNNCDVDNLEHEFYRKRSSTMHLGNY
jgi:hypothetical protein